MVDRKSYYHAPYSASQLELADTSGKGCLRRWARAYRDGLRSPAGDAAGAGQQVHDRLERYQKDGTLPDPMDVWIGPESGKLYPVGELATVMLPFVPKPGEAQAEFTFEYEFEGYAFTGRIDAQTENVVHDYKTTSKKKYAKVDLRDDIQAIIYAARPDAPAHLQWTTGIWDPGRGSPVVVTEHRFEDPAAELKRRVLPIVREIHDIPEGVDWLSLPGNPKSCQYYPPAGCPWSSTCAMHGYEGGKSVADVKESSLMAKIKRERAKTLESEAGTPVEQLTPEGTVPAAEGLKRVYGPFVEPLDTLIGTLYIDCLPLETEYTLASRFMAKAAQTVCDEHGLPHVRLADFAKGGPMLAAQLVLDLKTHVKAAGCIPHFVVETNMAEGREVILALTAEAKYVVRKI